MCLSTSGQFAPDSLSSPKRFLGQPRKRDAKGAVLLFATSRYFQPSETCAFSSERRILAGSEIKMHKIDNSQGQPSFKNVLVQRQDAASQFIVAQAVSTKWTTLPGSRPVRLAQLRGNMCRWPIGDPQHFDAFRFCGCRRLLGDSYCAAHKKMAFAPGKAARAIPVAKGSPASQRGKSPRAEPDLPLDAARPLLAK